MSSRAGLGQVQLGMERDRVSLPRGSVVSWGTPGLYRKPPSPKQAVTGCCGRTLGSASSHQEMAVPSSVYFFSFPPQDVKHCFHQSADLVPP